MDVIRELPEIFEELAQKKQQSFLTVKEYKDKGIPVIGSYCSYFPRELALAMGAIPIGLCSSSDETIEMSVFLFFGPCRGGDNLRRKEKNV